MTGRPSPDRPLRRSRAIGWATGAGASLATVGLIVGVAHSQAATTATSPTTGAATNSSTNSSSGSSNSSSGGASVQQAPAAQAPVAGSHGS